MASLILQRHRLGTACSRSLLRHPGPPRQALHSRAASTARFNIASSRSHSRLATATFATVTSLALLQSSTSRPTQCEPSSSRTPSDRRPYATSRKQGGIGDEELLQSPERVESIVSVSHLSFGTVTGLCAGVFVKKGLMVIAFLLGGGFVFLQYLHSRGLVTIKWSGFQRDYNRMIARQTANQRGESTLAKLWNGTIDFLTDDFQGRGMFVAGFALGFRMG